MYISYIYTPLNLVRLWFSAPLNIPSFTWDDPNRLFCSGYVFTTIFTGPCVAFREVFSQSVWFVLLGIGSACEG